MYLKILNTALAFSIFVLISPIAKSDYTIGYTTLTDKAGESWNGLSLTGLQEGFGSTDFIMTTSLLFGGENKDSMLWTLNSGPSYRITDSVALYGLGGISYLDTDSSSGSSSKLGFNLGGGARFYLNPRLVVNAGLEKSFVSNDVVSNPTSFNLGVGWMF